MASYLVRFIVHLLYYNYLCGGDTNGGNEKIEIQPFVKYIILKVDLLLGAKIVDEVNFAVDDEFAIMQFKRKYARYDNYYIVKIDM